VSRLAFLVSDNVDLADHGRIELACLYGDAIKLAGRVGQPILIARREPFGAATYIALANIGDIPVSADSSASLRLEQVHYFSRPVPLVSTPSDTSQLIELAASDFEQIAMHASGQDDWAENSLPQRDLFTHQLAVQEDEICAFSGVRTADGMAFIIRPLELGGKWHIENFLFLDPEPGNLFSALAWTIGPQLEIIVDAFAMGADIAETVSRSGILALNRDAQFAPDQAALAWHREQFFARLRG
jgi:hypothetical protein